MLTTTRERRYAIERARDGKKVFLFQTRERETSAFCVYYAIRVWRCPRTNFLPLVAVWRFNLCLFVLVTLATVFCLCGLACRLCGRVFPRHCQIWSGSGHIGHTCARVLRIFWSVCESGGDMASHKTHTGHFVLLLRRCRWPGEVEVPAIASILKHRNKRYDFFMIHPAILTRAT